MSYIPQGIRRKNMKKTVSLILAVIMIAATFASCTGPNADMTEENITATVDTAFTALVEFDTETLTKYVDSSTLNVIIDYAEDHDQFVQLGKEIFANLTYEIKSIDTENKTVTVSVKNKDLYLTAQAFTVQLTQKYSTLQLLNLLKSDAWLDNNLSELTADIGEAKMLEESTDITLTIDDSGKNLVLGFDENAENGVSGGALAAIKETIGV